jgi:hypothetical protein
MRRRSRSVAFLAALPVVAGLSACSHPASSLEDDVLHKGELRVQLGPVPSSWRHVDVAGADVAFRDDERSGSILFDVRCNGRDDDAPLSALTGHLIMGTTERKFETEEVVPFDRREAQHTVLRAKLDGVPMRYDIYVMKKNGCVFDLVYVAPPERFEEGANDFERFALGVHTPPDSAFTVRAAPSSDESGPGLSRRP